MMLLSFTIVSLNDGKLPPFTGNLVRGWFLNAIRNKSPEIASKLHSASGPKPFCVKPLRPVGFAMEIKGGMWLIKKDKNYVFDVGIVDESLSETIFRIIMENLDETIAFHKISFKIDSINVRKKSFEELYGADIGPRIGIEFLTPTAFSNPFSNFDYLFPEPVKLFGNLLRIWNTYAPENFRFNAEQALDEFRKLIKVRSYRLFTREVQIEKDITKVGVKGRMEIIVYDESLRKIVASLLGLSEFSNVGIKRTYGMGVIRYTDLSLR